MSQATLPSAIKFLDQLELPPAKKPGIELPHILAGVELPDKKALKVPSVNFDEHLNQATVVKSEVVSFVKGVSVARRKDIVNCSLLAQLAADEAVKDANKILEWYDVYFDTLTKLGWVLQDKGFSSHEEKADGLEAHEAILQVATTLLGAAPTALALVTSTINAMKSMDKDNPWITIFDRESRSAESAKFQIALAQENEDGQFLVNMMAFALKADSKLTQILFFKIWKHKVSFKHLSSKITVSEEILDGIRDKVVQILINRTENVVSSINIG